MRLASSTGALDDLHWADDMSLRLFAFVARRIHGVLPVLLILTARTDEMPEALARTLNDLDREFPLLQLSLMPLGREETARLASAVAGRGAELTTTLAEAVWIASEGNPFMAVETLRALGEKSVAEAPGGLPLPERVRRLIDGRLSRLTPLSRELVATAAVVGRDFEHLLLQEAAGLKDIDAVAGLEELIRRRVFHAVGDRFDFSHDRIREVAYASLLPPRRKLLHRRVAEAIERLHAGALEPHYAKLGLHYRQAEAWEKAATFLDLAGQEAGRRAAFREAGTLLRQALEALDHVPSSDISKAMEIDVRLHLHRWLYPAGDVPGMADNLTRARLLVEGLGDHRGRRAVMRVYESEYLRTVRDFTAAVEAGEDGLTLAQNLGDRDLEVEAHFHLGCVLRFQGRYREAIAHLEAMGSPRATQLRRLTNYPYAPGRAFVVHCLTDLGELAEARRRAEDGLCTAERIEHPVGLGHALLAMGQVELSLGCTTAAIPYLERSLASAPKWQIVHQLPISAAMLAFGYAMAGRVAETHALIDEAERQEFGWNHPRAILFRIPGYLGLAALLIGRLESARTFAADAFNSSHTTGARPAEAEALTLLGMLALHDAEHGGGAQCWKEGERSLHQGLLIAGELGMRPLEAHCHLHLTRVCAGLGRRQEAQQHFATATMMYRELGMTGWLEQAMADNDSEPRLSP